MPIPLNVNRQPFQCAVCEKVRVITDAVVTVEDSTVCVHCVDEHNSPFGRYSGCRDDAESLGTLLLLEAWDMNSGADDFMSNDGWGYCARIGRFLYVHDSQGFLSYTEYRDDAAAEKEFNDLYLQGWGADETDAYVSWDRGRVYISFEGKELDIWRPRHAPEWEAITERRALARVRLEMSRTGYYPNVWIVDERGGLRHASV